MKHNEDLTSKSSEYLHLKAFNLKIRHIKWNSVKTLVNKLKFRIRKGQKLLRLLIYNGDWVTNLNKVNKIHISYSALAAAIQRYTILR